MIIQSLIPLVATLLKYIIGTIKNNAVPTSYTIAFLVEIFRDNYVIYVLHFA